MQGVGISINESEHLRSSRELKLLNSAEHAQSETIVNVATLICGTSISRFSLVDLNRQRFPSNLDFNGLKLRADWSCHASV